MKYQIEKLQPFGAKIINEDNSSLTIESFSVEQLHKWISQYRVVVFKGFKKMAEQDLALFAQKLGKPMQWAFGAINHLKVKADAENYIFTDHAVPLHWDGAFAGTIPHVILFQCLIAPQKEDRGGTTFVNTEKVLEQANDIQLEEWKKISITYRTKKIVHYGGEITQSFIDKHEVEGKNIIRYAEPVDDLNPVTLEITGLQEKSAKEFIQETKETLYDNENLYTHRWEKGEVVLADNHTLLHGREAFKKANDRYIQRINILQRPNKKTVARFLENCLTIRRKEFFVAELPIFLIPLLLNISHWTDFTNPVLYVGLLAIILLFNIGDMINCYADYKLDAIYKSYLSNAVYELGKKNVKWQIILSGVLAIVLTIVVALINKQYYLIPLTIMGTIIGLQYSTKPFKFKSRGLWQLLCLWGIIFFGPMLYTAIISKDFPNLNQLLIFSLYGFHQMGIIMLNTAEDYTEDKANGLNTITIYLGLHRSMNVALGLVISSGILLQGLLFILFTNGNLPPFLLMSILAFTLGWLFILKEYYTIIKKLNKLDEDKAVKLIKKNGMKVPRWLKIGAYSFLIPILAYFIWNIFIT